MPSSVLLLLRRGVCFDIAFYRTRPPGSGAEAKVPSLIFRINYLRATSTNFSNPSDSFEENEVNIVLTIT